MHLDLPEIASDVAVDALLARLQWQLFGVWGDAFIALKVGLAVGDPAFAFGVERGLLLSTECRDAFGFAGQEGLVVSHVQGAVFDVQIEAAQREIATDA